MQFLMATSALLAAVSVALVTGADQQIEANGLSVWVMETGGVLKVSTGKREEEATTAQPEPEPTHGMMMTTEAPAAAAATTAAASMRRRRRRDTHMAAAGGEQRQVVVELVAVHEVDDHGEAVGVSNLTASTPIHAATNISGRQFTVSDVIVGDIPFSQQVDSQARVPAHGVDLSTGLDNGAQLKMIVYVPTKAGNVTLDGETTTIKPGMMKFTVEVAGWTWCTQTKTNCPAHTAGQPGDHGAMLEVMVRVTSTTAAAQPVTSPGQPASCDLGSGDAFLYSHKVEHISDSDESTFHDLTNTTMERATADHSATFTFRLPRFTKSARYDPWVSLRLDGGTMVGAAPPCSGPAALSALLALAASALVLTRAW